jgi:20S proteasome alpha/beta subunit
MNPDPIPHLGRLGQLPCACNGAGTCHPCRIREAMRVLEEVYLDDQKRAKAVHALIAAIKEAAEKDPT